MLCEFEILTKDPKFGPWDQNKFVNKLKNDWIINQFKGVPISVRSLFGVDIQKIDIMSNVGLAGTYGVKTLPCILLLKDGVEVDRLQGNIPLRLITEMINRHS